MPLIEQPAFPLGGALPDECSAHILSFLQLADTLNFAACSTSSMKEALPDLQRRRSRMKQRFAYWREWKTTGRVGKVQLWDASMQGDDHWVAMPTVEERVDQLSQSLPSAHKLYDAVYHLRQELAHEINPRLLNSCPHDFVTIFTYLRLIARALRLHSEILSAAVYADPGLDETSGTSLDQYIGDVLTLTYLINMSDLGLVEGCPTSAACSVVKEMRSGANPATDAATCYREWVYMHSSILRMKTFTAEQRERLGIHAEFSMISQMIPNNCYINDRFMSSEMILAFYEFGRLGPAFRGRDVIQVREISARCLFAFFVTDDVHLNGTTAQSALDWLCHVHEQARQSRPLTVSPPAIRLCMPPGAGWE